MMPRLFWTLIFSIDDNLFELLQADPKRIDLSAELQILDVCRSVASRASVKQQPMGQEERKEAIGMKLH